MTTIEDIVDAVATALARIKIADGYRTDAGLNPIYRGLQTLDAEHVAPTFSIWLPAENLKRERANVHNRDMEGSLLIAGWIKPGLAEDIQPLFDLRADVLRAVFKYGSVPELDALVEDYEYRGADYTPRRAGETFAEVVFEGFFKWREAV